MVRVLLDSAVSAVVARRVDPEMDFRYAIGM